MSKVTVMRTKPETVLDDYKRLLDVSEVKKHIPSQEELLLKLNLSWSLYYPACSTEPWQLEGVLKYLKENGYNNVQGVENKTVVTNVMKGVKGNKWGPIMERYNIPFIPLPEAEWVNYKPKAEMLAMGHIFPDGHKIPKIFIGKNVMHLPTLKCVHPQTEIFLADGSLVKIGDFVENVMADMPVEVTTDFDICSQSVEPVISLDKTAKLQGSLVFKFWKTPASDIIIKTTTKTGKVICTSKIHPFLTPEGWRSAEFLKKGDRIAVPRQIKIDGISQRLPPIKCLNHGCIEIDKINFKQGKKHSADKQKEIVRMYLAGNTATAIAKKYNLHYEIIRQVIKRYNIAIRWSKVWAKSPEFTSCDFWRWYGYFVAEGFANNTKGAVRFWWANGDEILLADFKALTAKLFDVKAKEKKDKRKCKTLYFDSNHLMEFFAKLGMEFPALAQNKSIPPILFKCPDTEIAAFLSGYFDGDGTCGKDGFHATTKSEKLANQLQLLLLRIGVISFKKLTYCMATNGKQTGKEPYYFLSVYGDQLITLAKHIKLLSRHKQKNMDTLVINRIKSKFSSNWDTIPVEPKIFRKVRKGLGFTQKSTGKPSSVNAIENGHAFPTKKVMDYFILLFEKSDILCNFKEEISYMKYLASEDVAWDYVEKVNEMLPDTPYLYDLSVFGTNNFIGNGLILHNTHGHTTMTGAMKNAFGGLITERRHHSHKMIHEVLVDLLQVQKEIHPRLFAVMDGAVAGNGKGPRTMEPVEANMILASDDQVAIDAVAARLMGFDPMQIPFIRIAHDKGLGCGDVSQIELLGDDVTNVNLNFHTGKSPVIFFDQLFRKKMKSLEPMLFHTGFFKLFVFGSAFYHDRLWYNTVGKARIREFSKTPWGQLFERY